MYLNEDIQKKWAPVLNHEDLAPIKDTHKRSVIATLLENTEKALMEASGQSHGSQQLMEANDGAINATGATVSTFDPVLISLVRRAMPNLIAYDICGVQPMTGPTGLIFAMRSQYANSTVANTGENFYNEVDSGYSAVPSNANTLGNKAVGTDPTAQALAANMVTNGQYNYATGMTTTAAEKLGAGNGGVFPAMGFTIEKVTVTAKSRALKAEYTMELAQDLKAIHGLDAETELSNILTGEILAEINREVVRTIVVSATQGCSSGTTTAGIFDLDVDANGRWSVEKFKGLMFQIEREANAIAKATRRGKGNIILCSSDVASALQMAGVLDYTPALNSNNLQVDDTGNTFAGVLNGRMKVYIDPYTTGNYMVVGYKGSSAFDAGLFYCPYVPLQMVRAVDQDSFAPKIGFKTRYGMVANPFAKGASLTTPGTIVADTNVYYRRTAVNNLL